MSCIVITVGDELLSGHTLDTNFHDLARMFTGEGHQILRHVSVGDSFDEIRAALMPAMAQAELVVVTGGLGGTPDDLTREAVAAVLDCDVIEAPELLD